MKHSSIRNHYSLPTTMIFAKKILTENSKIRTQSKCHRDTMAACHTQQSKQTKNIIIYLKQFLVSRFGKDYRQHKEPVNQIYTYCYTTISNMVITMCNFVVIMSINENYRGWVNLFMCSTIIYELLYFASYKIYKVCSD